MKIKHFLMATVLCLIFPSLAFAEEAGTGGLARRRPRVDSVWLFGPRTSGPCHNFCSGPNPETGSCTCPTGTKTLEFDLEISSGDCGIQTGVVGVCVKK